MVSNETLEIG